MSRTDFVNRPTITNHYLNTLEYECIEAISKFQPRSAQTGYGPLTQIISLAKPTEADINETKNQQYSSADKVTAIPTKKSPKYSTPKISLTLQWHQSRIPIR